MQKTVWQDFQKICQNKKVAWTSLSGIALDLPLQLKFFNDNDVIVTQANLMATIFCKLEFKLQGIVARAENVWSNH